MMEKQKQAIIYCRVSDAKQVKNGHGLESQETRCRQFAKLKGYEVIGCYHEQGVTGKLLDRPQIQAVLKFLKRSKHSANIVVIIDDISRLARDVQTHIQLRNAIAATGASLQSPSIEFKEDSDSKLVEHLLASVAAHHREKNAETTRNRMRARLMNGYWVSSAPIGYMYKKVSGHGKLLIRKEPEATILKEALEGYASGRFASQVEVQRFLERQEHYPKGKDGEIHMQRITDILRRILYAGYIHSPDKGINYVPAKHEALISYETYQRIQQRLANNKTAPINRHFKTEFLLRGFVSCAKCGKPLTGAFSKGRSKYYGYYHCKNKSCEYYAKTIRKEKLEDDISELIRHIQPRTGVENLAKDLFANMQDTYYEKQNAIHLSLKKKEKMLEIELEKIVEKTLSVESETLMAAFEKRAEKIENEMRVTREKIHNGNKNRPDLSGTLRTAIDFLQNPYKLWLSERIGDKITAIKLLFDNRIVYDKFEGVRTASIARPFRLLEEFSGGQSDMARPTGVEPVAFSSGG